MGCLPCLPPFSTGDNRISLAPHISLWDFLWGETIIIPLTRRWTPMVFWSSAGMGMSQKMTCRYRTVGEMSWDSPELTSGRCLFGFNSHELVTRCLGTLQELKLQICWKKGFIKSKGFTEAKWLWWSEIWDWDKPGDLRFPKSLRNASFLTNLTISSKPRSLFQTYIYHWLVVWNMICFMTFPSYWEFQKIPTEDSVHHFSGWG